MHIRDAIGNPTSLSEQLEYKADKSYTLLKGLYYQQLQHFYAQFNRERIKICLYEDLCDKPVEFMQAMYRFIGVEQSFSPDMSKKDQVAQVPKNQLVNKVLRQKNPVKTLVATGLRTILPESARQKLRSTLINLTACSGNK